MDPIADLHALVPAADRDACERTLRTKVPLREFVVRDAPPGNYRVRDDRFYDDARAARHGAVRGAMIGAAIGLIAVGIGWLAAAPWLLYVAFAAVFAGGIGAVIGLQQHEVMDDDPVRTMEVRAGEWALFSVHSAHFGLDAHRSLTRSGARLVEQDLPLPTGT